MPGKSPHTERSRPHGSDCTDRSAEIELAVAQPSATGSGGSAVATLSILHTTSTQFDRALYLEGRWRTGKTAKNAECRYRVTATIKGDTTYELEVIKARLVRAGANILRIDPITIVAEEPPDPPKHYCATIQVCPPRSRSRKYASDSSRTNCAGSAERHPTSMRRGLRTVEFETCRLPWTSCCEWYHVRCSTSLSGDALVHSCSPSAGGQNPVNL